MAEVTIYTRSWCGYCFRAKRLFEAKGVRFEEIDVDTDLAREREMIRKSGGRLTVPQIFIDGSHVGGSDELYDLDRRGELDRLLGFPS
jgi:glutaredoxin 3